MAIAPMTVLESKHRVMWAIVLVLAPLGVGALVYALLRPPGLLLDAWLASLDLSLPRRQLPIPASLRARIDWLPSAAWTFSLVAFVGCLHGPKHERDRALWLAVAGIVVLGWEWGQAVSILPGRFGWSDLFATVVAFALAMWCTGRKLENRA